MAHKKLIDRIKNKAILKFKSRIDDIIGVGILILPLLIIYILTKDLPMLYSLLVFFIKLLILLLFTTSGKRASQMK